MKAFDYDATDYLQKPIAIDRFNSSVKTTYTCLKLTQRRRR
jgi:response regulator of citrate/malate metabolism